MDNKQAKLFRHHTTHVFFLIAVWKDLYTVYTSALLPIASKFGPQEVNRCNQLCGLFHWAPDWFLLSRNAMIFVAAILGLQPRDKSAMLGVKTKEYFLEEFTWK